MPDKPTRADKISDAFLVLGSQYYTLARYCADRQYLPVSVTLFHHAVEMLLKGFISKTSPTTNLKDLGHNLVKLWQIFKAQGNVPQFSKFDTAITNLNRVEALRYPTAMVDDGFVLNVRFGTKTPLVFPGTEELPPYFVDVSDLDEIAAAVFAACSVPAGAYFVDVPPELKRALPPLLAPAE